MSKHIVITACEFCPRVKQHDANKYACKELGWLDVKRDEIHPDCPLENYNPQYATIDDRGKLVRVFVEGQREESE